VHQGAHIGELVGDIFLLHKPHQFQRYNPHPGRPNPKGMTLISIIAKAVSRGRLGSGGQDAADRLLQTV